MKPLSVKPLFLFLFLCCVAVCFGQNLSEEEQLISKLKLNQQAPLGILSSRSAVLFSPDYSQAELEEIQKGFQQMGVDAILYVESNRALAGHDLKAAYTRYFTKRDIKFLIFIRKEKGEYQFYFLGFNPLTWTDPEQVVWNVHATGLRQLLQSVFYGVNASQKRQNFLVNDYPERKGPPNVFAAGRDEGWAPNIKYFKLAIPRFGEPQLDKALEMFFKENFKGKYEFVDPNSDDRDLLQKEFVYVLRFIHVQGSLAKDILGYDMSKSESALVTVSYNNGTLQLKTIPSEKMVFKFYMKQLDDNIFYLGTKWDADITWQEALKNHLDAYRAAGRLN